MEFLSDEVKNFRHHLNKTQSEFSKCVGISRPTLWKIEHGKRPSQATYMLLSSYMGLDVTILTDMETKGDI